MAIMREGPWLLQLRTRGRRLLARLAWPGMFLLLGALIMGQQLLSFGNNDLGRVLTNSAHTPWFFLITLVLWALCSQLPGWSVPARQLLCAASVLALAILLEAVQVFTSRDASLLDMGRNLAGAIAGLLLIVAVRYRRAGRHRPCIAFGAVSLVILATAFIPLGSHFWQQMQRHRLAPDLIRFERFSQVVVARPAGEWEIVLAPAAWLAYQEQNVARITLSRPAQYPGFTLYQPLADWRGHEWLILEAFIADHSRLPLQVRLATFTERGLESTLRIELTPGPNRVRMPLARLTTGGNAGLDGVNALFLFTNPVNLGREFYLGSLHLE